MISLQYKITVFRGAMQTVFGPFDQLSAHILLEEILKRLGQERDPAKSHYNFDWRITPHGVTGVHMTLVRTDEEDLTLAQERFRSIFP